MTEFLLGAWEGLLNTSWIELVAVITGILYLVLVTRENLWCWFFAAVSTSLYVVILYQAELFSEMLLQFYYLFMAGYGFYAWTKGDMKKNDLPISWMGIRWNLILGSLIITGSVALGYIMANFALAKLPYIDAFTTIGALVTTWMVTRKYLDNWIYWIVIDGVGVWIYWQRELHLTALLFVLYVFLVIIGLIKWSRIYNSYQETEQATAS